MVTFSCDGCGEMLKKAKVDAHASRCRRCASVSCVDCSVSFYGDDFREHTTCTMIEVGNLVGERGDHSNASSKKKKKKLSPQEAWLELLQTSIADAPPPIKSYLQQMIQLDNIPRKEKQFRNFATNSLNFRGANAQKELDMIWSYLQKQREKQQQQQKQQQEQQQQQQQQESKNDTKENNGKDINQQNEQENTKVEEDSNNKNAKGGQKINNNEKEIFKNVKKVTKKMLKKAPGRQMKYKSLQKAIRETMGFDDIPKKQLKQVMEQVVAKESKKFLLEGKQIKLVMS